MSECVEKMERDMADMFPGIPFEEIRKAYDAYGGNPSQIVDALLSYEVLREERRRPNAQDATGASAAPRTLALPARAFGVASCEGVAATCDFRPASFSKYDATRGSSASLPSTSLQQLNAYVRDILMPFVFSAADTNLVLQERVLDLADGARLRMSVRPWMHLLSLGFEGAPYFVPQIDVLGPTLLFLTYDLSRMRGQIDRFDFEMQDVCNPSAAFRGACHGDFKEGSMKIVFCLSGAVFSCKSVQADVGNVHFHFPAGLGCVARWLSVLSRDIKAQFSDKLSAHLLDSITLSRCGQLDLRDNFFVPDIFEKRKK